MIINSTLKHNKFEQIDVPKGSDLFARVGKRVAPESSYSGEEVLDPSLGKVEAVKRVLREDVEDNTPKNE